MWLRQTPRKRRNGPVTATKLYTCWCDIRKRCRNPRHKNYPRYGGRGIDLSAEFDDYAAFREHVMALPGLTRTAVIDRVDNDRGYERNNLRWTTWEESNQNRF